jgi:hypothetical protein
MTRTFVIQVNRHISIATAATLIVLAVMLYVPATSSIRVVPALAQSSPDCANNGSNQANADVSRHSNTVGNQAQSQANQCAPLKCPIGNNGTATTEDFDNVTFESLEQANGDVSVSGSCFPSSEDEPSGNEEDQTAGEGVPPD